MSAQDLKNVATGKPANPIVIRQSFLEKRKEQLSIGMPGHMNVNRLVRSAVVAMMSNTALQECSEMSIYQSLSVAANLGLDLVGGQGYLVPYKGKCTFVPGWQGLVDLVSRSGRATVWTGAVFAGDDFDYAKGDRPFVKHKEKAEDDDWKKIDYVYAVGWVKGAEHPIIEVWTMQKVLNHLKKYNKVGARHYAYENMEMYARKVALLQVIKYLPKSQEMIDAVAASDAADSGKGVTIEGDFMVIHDDEDNKAPGAGAPTGGDGGQGGGDSAAQQQTTGDKPKANHGGGEATVTYAHVADKITKAEAMDLLEAAAELIPEVADPDQQAELHDLVRTRRTELRPKAKPATNMQVD